MKYQIFGLTLLILLLGTYILHIIYLNQVYAKIVDLRRKSVAIEEFYENMTVSQGSNFTGLAISAWIMLFVAIAFFYLLIPGKLPFDYMDMMSNWASSQIGFLAFGLIASILAIAGILVLDMLPEKHRNLKLTELYSFYSVSKAMKQMIALTIPFFGLSIILSAYLGTIYPDQNIIAEMTSFALLFILTVVLVLPVWVGRK